MRVGEVIHFEDEKLVGIVADYKSAGIIMHLLGYLCENDGTTEIFDSLDSIPDVAKFWKLFMNEDVEETSDLCGYYGRMLKEAK